MTTLKHTWHHIRRSPIQSLTAIFIMVISFFVLSLFAIAGKGMGDVLKYFETKPEVTIFLKDGLDKVTVENFQKEIAKNQFVKEIRFISKEKALNIYKEQNKDNPMLTEMVTASILPASFEITVSDPKALDQIVQNFSKKTQIVDEIIYQKDIIKSLLKWTNAIRQIGFVVALIVSVISFLTIFIIVSMKITNRKDEIRISRLLGASKYYVKKPFLLEGIIYGLIGSFIGASLSFALAYYFEPRVNTFFNPIKFISFDVQFYISILFAEILFGTFVGFLASWFGVRRYIKF